MKSPSKLVSGANGHRRYPWGSGSEVEIRWMNGDYLGQVSELRNSRIQAGFSDQHHNRKHVQQGYPWSQEP